MFNRVTVNFTVNTQGRQFDRLGIMYLGDIEVFRTSTAEPTPQGIVWTYVKEMQQYNALWKTEQKIIFDLPNIVNEKYTGPLSTSLTATFFTEPDPQPAAADTILPISSRASGRNKGSAFTVPNDNASVSLTFPQNVDRAVVSLSACGQQTEEFWYMNVLSTDVHTFEPTVGTLNGFSPFREVHLLIDGELAGIVWPFPIIFTGGIAPGLWRPIVGIGAFDLRQHEIDITPWLPVLCDGANHTFEIKLAGLAIDGEGHGDLSGPVGSYWLVTGTVFLFLDKEGSRTTGLIPSNCAPAPKIQVSASITTNVTGANETLACTVSVSRSISITSTLNTSTGNRRASWTQRLFYANDNNITSQGLVQNAVQSISGNDTASSGYSNSYFYPLTVDSSFATFPNNGFGIKATLSRGFTHNVFGPSVFPLGIQNFDISTPRHFVADDGVQTIESPSPALKLSGALLSTMQSGSAEYLSTANLSYSFGTTTQDFVFEGAEFNPPKVTTELYKRHVKAVNSSVVEDEEALIGKTVRNSERVGAIQNDASLNTFGRLSVRNFLGRGP